MRDYEGLRCVLIFWLKLKLKLTIKQREKQQIRNLKLKLNCQQKKESCEPFQHAIAIGREARCSSFGN